MAISWKPCKYLQFQLKPFHTDAAFHEGWETLVVLRYEPIDIRMLERGKSVFAGLQFLSLQLCLGLVRSDFCTAASDGG